MNEIFFRFNVLYLLCEYQNFLIWHVKCSELYKGDSLQFNICMCNRQYVTLKVSFGILFNKRQGWKVIRVKESTITFIKNYQLLL
jgi:hypothetical protein